MAGAQGEVYEKKLDNLFCCYQGGGPL